MESVHWLGWHKSGAERIQVAGLSGEQLPHSTFACQVPRVFQLHSPVKKGFLLHLADEETGLSEGGSLSKLTRPTEVRAKCEPRSF